MSTTPKKTTLTSFGAAHGSALHVAIKPLRIGGVLRCCAHTLAVVPVAEIEGETLQCKYTADPLHSLIFRDGAWEWNRPNDPSSATDGPKTL